MNPFARIERACAKAVEETFARIFPSDLDPAQVGRKLVALVQSDPGDLYLVRVHPADFARFDADRAFLEARWSMLMAASLAAGERRVSPRAVLHEDPAVVAGSVAIEAVSDDGAPRLGLRGPDGVRYVLRDGLRLGRSADNDVVLHDRRVSRHHARIVADGDALRIADLGSSNGTFIDGRAIDGPSPALTAGTTIVLGGTALCVDADGG